MEASTGRAGSARALYEAFVAGDYRRLVEQLDPAVEFVNPLDAVEPGTRSGVPAFVRAVKKLNDMFAYDRLDVVDLSEHGDDMLVVIHFRARGRGSDVPIEAEFAHVLRWRGERLVRLEWFRSRAEAAASLV